MRKQGETLISKIYLGISMGIAWFLLLWQPMKMILKIYFLNLEILSDNVTQ